VQLTHPRLTWSGPGLRLPVVGFIGRAIGRKITKVVEEFASTPEGKAALERNEGTMAAARVAKELAGSDQDDSSACAELRLRMQDGPEAARDAAEHLRGLRTSYLQDRAYRQSRGIRRRRGRRRERAGAR
jgi:hypothetical protein